MPAGAPARLPESTTPRSSVVLWDLVDAMEWPWSTVGVTDEDLYNPSFPASDRETVPVVQGPDVQTGHRLAQIRGDLRDHLRVVVIGHRRDDGRRPAKSRLPALGRIRDAHRRLEDATAHE